MNMPTRLAIFCADYRKITGQALVTRRVVEHLLPQFKDGRLYVYTTGFSVCAVVSWLIAVVRFWFDLMTKPVSTIYVVCSRSNAGFLRDVPALILAHIGYKVIVHSHGSDIVGLLTSRMFSPFVRWLYAPCILIIPSPHLLAPLACVRLRELIVIENFSTARPSTVVMHECDPGISLRLLWNSNLMASKGAFDTLTAASSLKQDGFAVIVDVLGVPMADEEMSKECAMAEFDVHRNSGNICYHGSVPVEISRIFLEKADVVALPSRYVSECQPLSVIEAMCAGKALIVSDSPALSSTIADYPAEVVPLRNVSAIRQSLVILDKEKRSDPAAFFARRMAASAAAQRRFSVERFDMQMSNLFIGSSVVTE
jgi:glycosyltransferase involved in cell wall biosynthesis